MQITIFTEIFFVSSILFMDGVSVNRVINKTHQSKSNDAICACTGIRKCAFCFDGDCLVGRCTDQFLNHKCLVYNLNDGIAHFMPSLKYNSPLQDIYIKVENLSDGSNMHDCTSECVPMDGVLLIKNFISCEEEKYLLSNIEYANWKPSQSGRRKQDYGPQVNFKRKKINLNSFLGLPKYIDLLLTRMKENKSTNKKLVGFIPVELCNLEYTAERLSSIDMHIDDMWLWGERLISVNLLSDTVITLRNAEINALVFIPTYRQSLLCLSGLERSIWEHGVLPTHIIARRIVITLREAATSFMEDGENFATFGHELLLKSNKRIETKCSHHQ